MINGQYEQINLFSLGKKKFKIEKPIRLIELFAGIGSQAMAFRDLGADFEHYKVVEFDKYAIKSYNAIHGTDFEPMDITKIIGSDLGISDTDKYCYIMTYSFPCQDLSVAGKQKGMTKGSGTRSGLLWEVERILDECNGNLPQILLMENVPEVIGTKNSEHFSQWVEKLDSLGYKSKWEILNAKDYGVPQNRARCFMVSWLGNYYYDFSKRVKLEKRLKDILETNVDEKYYLNDDTIERISKWKSQQQPLDRILNDNSCSPCLTARGGGEEHSGMILYGEVKCNCVGMLGGKYEKLHDIARRIYDTNGIAPTQHTCGGGNLETKILVVDEQNEYIRQDGIVGTLTTDGSSPKHNNRIIENLRIRKLTPKECGRLMGVRDKDIDTMAVNQSNSSQYHLYGDSIVVDVLMAIFGQML